MKREMLNVSRHALLWREFARKCGPRLQSAAPVKRRRVQMRRKRGVAVHTRAWDRLWGASCMKLTPSPACLSGPPRTLFDDHDPPHTSTFLYTSEYMEGSTLWITTLHAHTHTYTPYEIHTLRKHTHTHTWPPTQHLGARHRPPPTYLDVLVHLRVHGGQHTLPLHLLQLLPRRPDVPQVHGLAVAAMPQRLLCMHQCAFLG